MKIKFKIFICIFLFTGSSFAEELYDSYRAARAMGMGGAYTGVVQGLDSLFYNPASLADIRGVNFNLMDLGLGVSDVDQAVIDSLQELQDSSTIAQALQDLYGEPVALAANIKAGLALPGFAIAGYGFGDLSLTVNNPVIPNVEMNAIVDVGLAMGFGFRLNSLMNFGVVARRVTRYGDRQTFTASSVSQLDPEVFSDAFEKKGNGLGVDVGLDFVGRGSFLIPKLSLVYKDIGNTSFTSTSSTLGPPPTQEAELIYSGSLIFDASLASLTLAADYRHALKEDVSDGKKIHAGAELSLPIMDLRAGLNQGYITYGVGLNFGLFRLDAASYGLETGEKLGQKEERRYSAQLSLEFGFDFAQKRGRRGLSSMFKLKKAGRGGRSSMGTSGGRRAYKRQFYKNYLKPRR